VDPRPQSIICTGTTQGDQTGTRKRKENNNNGALSRATTLLFSVTLHSWGI